MMSNSTAGDSTGARPGSSCPANLQQAQSSSPVTGVAIDLGGTKLAVARFVNGHVAAEQRWATRIDASINDHVSHIEHALQSVGLCNQDRLGIAVTGRIDAEGRWYAVNASTLTQVRRAPLKALLEQRLGRQFTLLNDAVAAGLGEAHHGAGQGIERFCYITVSTGVGGVCVLHGVPLTSPDGLAGHVGFMTCRAGKQRCGSGRIGTVESMASGHAIARMAAEMGHAGLDAKAVFEASRTGAAWAQAIIDVSAQTIAELGVNLAVAVGIKRIVLGGSIALAEGYREQVQRALEAEPALFRIGVVAAGLGQYSSMVGVLECESGFSYAFKHA